MPGEMSDTATDAATETAVDATDHASTERPRDPTLGITLAVAGGLLLVATGITVLIWLYVFGAFGARPGAGGAEGPGARPWHYWLSLLLASGLPFIMAALGFGYYWKLIRPRLLVRR